MKSFTNITLCFCIALATNAFSINIALSNEENNNEEITSAPAQDNDNGELINGETVTEDVSAKDTVYEQN